MELLDEEKYCYIYLNPINSINIKYEFVGEVILNPMILSEQEGFGSIVASVTSNPNFVDGILKSFMLTSGALMVVTTIILVIGKLAILKAYANVVRDAEKKENSMLCDSPLVWISFCFVLSPAKECSHRFFYYYFFFMACYAIRVK